MPRLLPVLFLLVAANTMAAQSQTDIPTDAPAQEVSKLSAQDWLARLSSLVTKRNFEASFVVYRMGEETVPYLWRHGILEDGTEMEQLSLQNGPGREFIRVNNRVSVFEPDVPPYSIIGASINGPIPAALLRNERDLLESYEFVVVGRSRISGRPAKQIRIVSRDDTRFSYQLWVDEETAMLLKLNMLNDQGKIIEQVQMSTFAVSATPHEYFNRVNQARLPQLMATNPIPDKQHGWDVSFLPVGMKEVKQDTRRLAITGKRVEYRMFSDGLTDVSVYVEPATQSINDDVLTAHKLTTFLSRQIDGAQITVIGEIPPKTANAIAMSIIERVEP
jgi:sigma-E factor negative regulatory protein RseB